MEHITEILSRPSGARVPAAWQRAAEAVHATARAHSDHPASLRQLRRVCQLLTSHTLQERERRRAVVVLTHGCTDEQARAMLEYLIPRVQERKACEASDFLDTLLRGCTAVPSSSRRSESPR